LEAGSQKDALNQRKSKY